MMMARLREATRSCHEAVEARLGGFRFTDSIEAYRRALRLFYGFHHALEDAFSQISGWERIGIDPVERRKTSLLEADLDRLGLDDGALAGGRRPSLPSLTDLPEALGAMYVMEGSTLGGRYLRKQVELKLGLTPETGCAYFSSYGDRVVPMWKAFGSAVDAFATTDEIQRSVERSAVATFQAFDDWFASGYSQVDDVSRVGPRFG